MKNKFYKYVPLLLLVLAFTVNSCSEESIDNKENFNKKNKTIIDVEHYGILHNEILGEVISVMNNQKISSNMELLELTKDKLLNRHPEFIEHANGINLQSMDYMFDLSNSEVTFNFSKLFSSSEHWDAQLRELVLKEYIDKDGITTEEFDLVASQLSKEHALQFRAFKEVYISSQKFWSSNDLNNLFKCGISRRQQQQAENQVYLADAAGALAGATSSFGIFTPLGAIFASALVRNIQHDNYCGGPITD
jgi:hypothetical protein